MSTMLSDRPYVPQSSNGGNWSGCQGWLAGWCFHASRCAPSSQNFILPECALLGCTQQAKLLR
eukprot:8858679-Prorocentrum_lima.AAC.1